MPVQKTVNREYPAAYHGDFASANPRFPAIGREGAWRAGSGGVTVGSFVWCDEDNRVVNNTGKGAPDGFIRRGGLSVITAIPQAASMTLLSGQPVTVYELGEFWVDLPAGVTATRKAPVYCNTATGAIVASGGSNATQTRYFYAESGVPGGKVKISAYLGAPVAPSVV